MLRGRELGHISLEPIDSEDHGAPKILPSIQSLRPASAGEPHNESEEVVSRCISESAQMQEPKELKQQRSPTTILISCLSRVFLNCRQFEKHLACHKSFRMRWPPRKVLNRKRITGKQKLASWVGCNMLGRLIHSLLRKMVATCSIFFIPGRSGYRSVQGRSWSYFGLEHGGAPLGVLKVSKSYNEMA